jgi:hypothetical protein
MSTCPSKSNKGFIKLPDGKPGSIQEVTNNPITTSFGPLSSQLSLYQNSIIDQSSNSCQYRGHRYDLKDIQICNVIHSGYQLLENIKETPIAELVLSFSISSNENDPNAPSTILLCMLIYNTGTPRHDAYLTQLVSDYSSLAACNFTNNDPGTYYTIDPSIPSQPQPQIQPNYIDCLSQCCNDMQCFAYNYDSSSQMCSLSYSNPPPKEVSGNQSIQSGSISRNTLPSCGGIQPAAQGNNTAQFTTIESLFQTEGGVIQSSYNYMMCLDLYDNGDDNITSSSTVYISVFPNGIHLSSKVWSLLYAKMNNTLLDYQMPYNMRNNMRTVEYYIITSDGTNTTLSTEGVINSSAPFTGCSNTMQFSIEKCVNPPMKSTSAPSPTPNQRALIPTEQYKCSPFNQKTGLDKSGKNVKIGGGSLADIINNENVILTDQNNTATEIFSEDFVKTTLPAVGITVGIVILAFGVGAVAKKFFYDN